MATFIRLFLIDFPPLKPRLLLNYPCHHFYSYHSSSTTLLRHHHPFSTSTSSSFMEVVKAVAKQGSVASNSIAIRADKQSYSYRQLILFAQRISSVLCTSASPSTLEGIQLEHSSVSVDGKKSFASRDGIRVGIVAKPSVEFVASVLGIWLSGGVAVPLALSYPEAELLHVMNDSDVSMVLSTEDHQELMQTIATKSAAQFSLIPPVPSITPETETTADGHSENGGSSSNAVEVSTNIEGENAALVIYTSGTTGKPKGVIHTHQSVLAQVQMLKEAWGYSSSDQFLHCLPLHHVHGLFNALLAPLYAGATVEFLPKFSVSGIWQRWRESYPTDGTDVDSAITVFTGVPTMYTRLIQGYEAMQPDVRVVSASAAGKLRLMMCGSSALPYPVMQQWENITGHRLLERYGMTEFVMALSNPLKGLRKGGTVGKPLPGVQVKIIAEDDSGNAPDVGELCVKSPSLFREYWKLPEVTRSSFTDDGFFKTGDAVTKDEDGYFIILGRTSADIMKVGGYKLSALEIEAALLEHPSVSECCVLGLPDKTYGEAVCAIIVPREEIQKKQQEESKPALTLEELVSWAKEKLAPYKLPTQLFLWESLPRNAMGKVNKKELKKSLVSEGQ